ncbi:hypothetical protein NKJ28_00255 [Mesorhizobium sp. M0145]|uniref:hypothetical protein n=1 Tax=Mesorhizobium sp. M0145 TaxID=2956895 RepID=UPI0033352509
MFTPVNLNRWTRPDCYAGAEWPEYFSSGCGQSRDSDSLERSNFECMLKALGGESETVRVIRESHWAVGWVEWVAIHETDDAALETADEIKAALEDYPVVDESHWSDLEFTETVDYWASMSTRERADYILSEVKRYHWLKPSLMRFRPLLKSDYSPGCEEGLNRDQSMVSRALEESLRH